MQNFLYLIGFGLGVVIGLAYFAGLWLTVRRVPDSSNPGRLLGLSLVARMLPAMAVMWLVLRYDPGMFLAMLPGFLVGRFCVSRRVAGPCREKIHAPQS